MLIALPTDCLQTHAALIAMACKWPTTDPGAETPRLILNLRFIVPFFHAVQVDFYRTATTSTTGGTTSSRRRDQSRLLRASLAAIVQTAAVVHGNEQAGAMCRIAWALFVAAVESSADLAHQSWLLERFRALEGFGLSFRRAGVLLAAVVAHQRRTGERVDCRRWIKERPGFEAFIL